jgi:hypothetical protein
MIFEAHIETTLLMERLIFIGGLDTPFAKNAQGYSTTMFPKVYIPLVEMCGFCETYLVL